MQYKYSREGGSLTVTRIYDSGEKFLTSYAWDRKLGKPSCELVERLIKDCRFVRVIYDNYINSMTFKHMTRTHVLVEQTVK